MDLNFFEQKYLKYLPSITAITFYEGDPPIAFMRDRLAAVINANMWLAGTLRKGTNGAELVLPTRVDTRRVFTEIDMPGLRVDMHPGKEMLPRLLKLMVKEGIHDEPIFLVTMIRIEPTRFAVLVSMSHVIADGYTYYQICGMLSSNGVVTSLNANRDNAYSPQLMSSIHGEEKLRGATSASSFIGAFVLPRFFAPTPCCELRFVDIDWVTEQKKLFNTGAQYVSTNDILTSWFFNNGTYTCGFMAVNLRGRVPSITQSLAGNYESGVHYFPHQYATPIGIRKALVNKAGLRTSVFGSDFNTVFERLQGKAALATNWAGLHQDITLPGCQQVVHFPVIKSEPTFGAAIVIFQATKERLGVYIGGSPAVVAPYLKSEAVSDVFL